MLYHDDLKAKFFYNVRNTLYQLATTDRPQPLALVQLKFVLTRALIAPKSLSLIQLKLLKQQYNLGLRQIPQGSFFEVVNSNEVL